MLVLSRKRNESVVINDDISIIVVEIRGDKVRLGVEAPKEVPVHRREIYDAINRKEAAAGALVEEIDERPRELNADDVAKPAAPRNQGRRDVA